MRYRTNTPYWGPKKAKLNVLGPILSKSALNNAPIRMKGPNETWQQPELTLLPWLIDRVYM
jgi:hypothetical protein